LNKTVSSTKYRAFFLESANSAYDNEMNVDEWEPVSWHEIENEHFVKSALLK